MLLRFFFKECDCLDFHCHKCQGYLKDIYEIIHNYVTFDIRMNDYKLYECCFIQS